MNQHCKYCNQPCKPRKDRPGKFFTLCSDHYAEYQRQKNRESYRRHKDKRVISSQNYRDSNPEKIQEYSTAYYSRPENKERKRLYQKTYERPWKQFVKDACEKCGYKSIDPVFKRDLDVHHKDGDKKNNEPSNLQTLCPPCHRLLQH